MGGSVVVGPATRDARAAARLTLVQWAADHLKRGRIAGVHGQSEQRRVGNAYGFSLARRPVIHSDGTYNLMSASGKNAKAMNSITMAIAFTASRNKRTPMDVGDDYRCAMLKGRCASPY